MEGGVWFDAVYDQFIRVHVDRDVMEIDNRIEKETEIETIGAFGPFVIFFIKRVNYLFCNHNSFYIITASEYHIAQL